MSGPSLIPPGALHHHLALVALTPALLALGATVAAAAVRGSGARTLAAIALIPPLVLQAALLLPDGLAAQAGGPQLGGLVRLGWIPATVALLLGGWATWRWRASERVWSWPLRVAAALLLSVLMVPALTLAIEPDAPPIGRRWRVAVALALTPLAWWWPAWAMAAACAVAATASGPWRAALAAATLAALAAALLA